MLITFVNEKSPTKEVCKIDMNEMITMWVM